MIATAPSPMTHRHDGTTSFPFVPFWPPSASSCGSGSLLSFFSPEVASSSPCVAVQEEQALSAGTAGLFEPNSRAIRDSFFIRTSNISTASPCTCIVPLRKQKRLSQSCPEEVCSRVDRVQGSLSNIDGKRGASLERIPAVHPSSVHKHCPARCCPQTGP